MGMDRVIREVHTARYILGAVCAFMLMACPVYGLDTAPAALTPEIRVYDEADIFTGGEEEELNAILGERSSALQTHFAIVTTEGNTIEGLESFSRQFYERALIGQGGVSNCVLLTIDMSIRQVAIDGFGDLRQSVGDAEWTAIRENLTPDLSEGNYAQAARIFIDDAYALVEARYEEDKVDVPEADASERLYDFAAVFSDEQRMSLSGRIQEISENLNMDFVIAVIPEGEDEDYLTRYAASFYKRNFIGVSTYNGAYMLVVSPESGTVSAVPLGTFILENYDLYVTNARLSEKLTRNSVYTACDYFLYLQEEKWLLEHMEIPVSDPEISILDYADFLTGSEEEEVLAEIKEKSNKYDVKFYLITIEYWSSAAVSKFQNDFIYNNLNVADNALILAIGGQPEVEGEYRQVKLYTRGQKVWDKVDYSAEFDIEQTVQNAFEQSGDYLSACLQYVGLSSKYLGSIIPDINMIRTFPQNVLISFIGALVIAAIILLVLRIKHNKGLKKELTAQNYLKSNSLRLDHSTDTFLHTHTSQTRIERDSSSGGGSGSHSGSGGGGTSSRSQGGF
jgi:uncharacterized membrane protein YgcG